MLIVLLDRLHALLRVLVTAAFLVLLGAVLLQVVSRLTLPNPPVWTEEMSRFALIFSACLGAGLALRTGDLVNVDIVTSFLPARAKVLLEIVVMLGIIVFCAVLVPGAWDFVDIGSLQTSPALGWNMFYVHMAVLIAPATLALACLERILRNLASLRGDR